ncbi:MAG: cytochrome c oxidase subunit II [Bacteroidia bacterium]|nr:cytochrome c oxidase subunit II [Bacteroidia bacterium]
MLLQVASNFVEGVDKAFFIIMGIGVFFIVGLTSLMLIFVFKYNKKKHPQAVQVKERTMLEVVWTVIPLIIVGFMFYYGYIAFIPMREAPKDALQITAVGKMWEWNFIYENGKESKKLVVPFNKAVNLKLVSVDVVHSIYIPAYRIKEDMVKGEPNFMWFIPTQKGRFDIFCAEYCGVRHSYMSSEVNVIDEDKFNLWLSIIEKKSKKEELPGFLVIKNNACTGCHSLDGTKLVGPSFKGLYGRDVTVVTNDVERNVKSDDEYIKNSILNPDNDVVKGYNKGLMKSYQSILKEEEIQQIIEYFKTPDEK